MEWAVPTNGSGLVLRPWFGILGWLSLTACGSLLVLRRVEDARVALALAVAFAGVWVACEAMRRVPVAVRPEPVQPDLRVNTDQATALWHKLKAEQDAAKAKEPAREWTDADVKT